jgi:DNA helicase-2/ATP-dependent DNA helicase PcrA
MAFPNAEQNRVLTHRGQPLVVLAGPGTGKTASLVARMFQILAEDINIPVAFITFTRTSRRDTYTKLIERFGSKVAKYEAEDTFPKVSTLHTFAKSIVHRRANLVGLKSDFPVLVSSQNEDLLIIQEAVADIGISLDSQRLRDYIAADSCGADVSPDYLKASGEDIDRVITRVKDLMRFYNTIDINGLVLAGRYILERDPGIVGDLFLHVDEYQDLNKADQIFVDTLISAGCREIVVAGDDDQSIYGRRFANPEGIRYLIGKEGWASVIFKEGHRVPPHIFRAAQALLKLQKRTGHDKGLSTPQDDGRKVDVFQCTSTSLQCDKIVQTIRQLMKRNNEKEQKCKYSDFMVLSPHKKAVVQIAKCLEAAGIPTRKKESKPIPPDLWQVLLLLRMVCGDDNVSLRQWLPIIGLSEDEIRAIRLNAESKGRTLFEEVGRGGEEKIIEFLGHFEGLRASKNDLKELMGVAGLVRRLYQWYGILETEEEVSEEDKVLLTTLHSAKGLEAPFVLITHLEDRFMPNPSLDQDEETRVLYVGMTRAKEELFLLFCERFDRAKRRRLQRRAMSPFLLEIAPHLRISRWRRAPRKSSRR